MIAFLAAAAAMAAPAIAQLSTQGGPIEINADRGQLNDRERRAVYSGNVDIIQSDSRLRAEEVVIEYNARTGPQPSGEGVTASIGGLKSITATGDVYYLTIREKVRADKGVYTAESDTITLTGDVIVTNDDGVVNGERLVIEASTGRSTMFGGETTRIRTVIEPQADENTIQ
ncbi:MAG: LptA/OstA family protein [Pseudomonadota bacterium]